MGDEHYRIKDIERRDILLSALNELAGILLQAEPDTFEVSLKHCLRKGGETLGVDRVRIWKNQPGDDEAGHVLTHEWVSDEVLKRVAGGEAIHELKIGDVIYGWDKILFDGKCVNSRVSDMPPDIREWLEAQGTLSVFAAPVFINDELWGHVSFINCHDEGTVTEGEETILQGASLQLVSALLRNDMAIERRSAGQQLEMALNEARSANQAKSRFLAKVSHEMRTPLNAVIGLTELLLAEGDFDEQARSSIEKVNNAGTTLLNTVNDLLDISKLEAGKLELLHIEYDVPSLLNDAVTQSIMYIGDKPIDFTLNVLEDLPMHLAGDNVRIMHVLNNLLSNAFKYTKEGNVEFGIRHSLESGMAWLTIWVRDTGIGIKPEDLGNIFTDYTRMDIETNRDVTGTGLGLPITKKIVEMLGGDISVESKYGSGSKFTINIGQRLASDAVIGADVVKSLKSFNYSDHKRQSHARIAKISLPNVRILVVDDNPTNLHVMLGLLKPYDVMADDMLSGQEAVDAIRAGKPIYDAIFMDHMMPEMSGVDATRLIREIGTEYAKNIPVVAFTANAVVGSKEMFLQEGFQDFLSKPIDIKELDLLIRRLLLDTGKDMEDESLHSEQQKDKGIGSALPQGGSDRRIMDDRRSGIDRRALKKGIEGVDISGGIERFGGDRSLYFDVLQTFVASTPPLLESIANVNPDNLSEYAIIVHGIKGAGRGIRADVFSDIAEVLEKEAKGGNIGFVLAHNTEFVAAAWQLISDIKGMLKNADTERPRPVKAEPDLDILNELRKDSLVYDMDGVDAALAELARFEYENDSDTDLVTWLREQGEQSKFAEIAERLSVLEG